MTLSQRQIHIHLNLSFSTQLVKRLHIKSFSTQKGDTINFNSISTPDPTLIILQSGSFLASYIQLHVFNKFQFLWKYKYNHRQAISYIQLYVFAGMQLATKLYHSQLAKHIVNNICVSRDILIKLSTKRTVQLP